MNDLTVVVPLGISSPGTPVIRFLEASIESLQKQQTYSNAKKGFCQDF